MKEQDVGLVCVYIGIALLFGVIWALILVPLVLLIVQQQVIAKEERCLDQKFGEAYREYRTRVRRWI